MRAFNRILVVLIVLLTIGSAVLAVYLYLNRNLMRDRADTMAEAIADMVQTLEQESQTGLARRVTFDLRNQETGAPDAGTLSWQSYLEDRPDFISLNNAVDDARELAELIHSQRNHLAQTLAEAAQLLGHPEAALLRTLRHADPQQYQAKTQSIMRLVEAVNSQTNDFVDALVAIADQVEVSVNRNDFFQRRQERDQDGVPVETEFQHQTLVRRIRDGVRDTVAARNEYRDAVTAMINQVPQHDWSVAVSEVRDRTDYLRALTAMVNDFEGINAELIRSAQRQEQLVQLRAEMEELQNRLQRVTAERNRMEARLSRLEPDIDPADPDRLDPDVDPQAAFPRDQTGLVVQVNPRFGFVIIDLGADDHVSRGLNLLVDRDGEFIARIEVSQVTSEFAVAEVLPRIMVDQVRVGDRVISP